MRTNKKNGQDLPKKSKLMRERALKRKEQEEDCDDDDDAYNTGDEKKENNKKSSKQSSKHVQAKRRKTVESKNLDLYATKLAFKKNHIKKQQANFCLCLSTLLSK